MKTKNFVGGVIAALIFVISGYAQIKLPTRTLVGISFDEATPTERLSEYIRDMKVYDIFLNVPDTLRQHIDFDQFCEFILPYKVAETQELKPWREEFAKIGLDLHLAIALFTHLVGQQGGIIIP